MDYCRKVILLTGASSGIGRATILKLAAHENKIAITARRKELLADVAEAVRNAGSECLAFPGDATNAKHAEIVVRDTVSRWGRIDIAILNVGAGPATNLLTSSAERILGCMRANYDSMVNFYVPMLRQMRAQTTRGLITHINSLASYFGIPMQGDYTAAKAAARILFETARIELEHFGVDHIRLQTIHPGFVNSKPKQDKLPRPHEMSLEAAVDHILRAIRSEAPEYRFPAGMALATRVGRIAPLWLKTKILLGAAPKQY